LHAGVSEKLIAVGLQLLKTLLEFCGIRMFNTAFTRDKWIQSTLSCLVAWCPI